MGQRGGETKLGLTSPPTLSGQLGIWHEAFVLLQACAHAGHRHVCSPLLAAANLHRDRIPNPTNLELDQDELLSTVVWGGVEDQGITTAATATAGPVTSAAAIGLSPAIWGAHPGPPVLGVWGASRHLNKQAFMLFPQVSFFYSFPPLLSRQSTVPPCTTLPRTHKAGRWYAQSASPNAASRQRKQTKYAEFGGSIST